MTVAAPWLWSLITLSTLAHVIQYFICGTELFVTEDNPFIVIARIVVFGGCEIHIVWQFVLFTILSLPFFLVTASMLISLAGSEIGAVVVIALGVITALVGFFA